MSTEPDTTPDGVHESRLDRARTRRHELRLAMADLETAVAGAVRDEESWMTLVRAALTDVGEALRAHVDEVESAEGLLADILAVDPRLAPMVDDLQREHPELLASWDRANRALTGDTPNPQQVRRRVVTLLGRLAVHRQTGADLVYEAYQVDIGGQG